MSDIAMAALTSNLRDLVSEDRVLSFLEPEFRASVCPPLVSEFEFERIMLALGRIDAVCVLGDRGVAMLAVKATHFLVSFLKPIQRQSFFSHSKYSFERFFAINLIALPSYCVLSPRQQPYIDRKIASVALFHNVSAQAARTLPIIALRAIVK